MPQQDPAAAHSPDGARGSAGWRGSRARLALAACLTALVAAGLRAAVRAPRLDGPLRHDGLLIGAIVEAVLACLAVALVVRHLRAPRDALLAARMRKVLGYVVGAGLIAIPVLYLLNRQAGEAALRPLTVRPHPTPATSHPQTPRASTGTSAAPVIVLLLLIVLAAVLIFLIARYLWRNWPGQSIWPRKARGFPVPASADDEPGLREAVESGYSALRGLDDARAAIIACYLAMEDSLARAGTPRGAADTPDELLARAAARGLVRGGAAARLTVLFDEARFSSHPMRRANRDDAERSLAELAAGLAGAVPAGAAAGPGTGTGARP